MWEESRLGLSGLRIEWMRKPGKNEGIGWQRNKAPVWLLCLLTRHRSLLQSMMERLNREMSVDFFCPPLSIHVFLCPMNLHIGLMIESQTAYVPSAYMRPSPCVVSDLWVKALCSYWGRIRLLLTARPTQLEINMGKERKRKADGQRFICKSSI